MATEPRSRTARSSGVDPAALAWMDGQIKETKEAIEKRLSDDREFIQDVLGLAVKICAASLVLVLAVIGFFGYKDISSIDDRINKSVNDKIKEKSEEFSRIYEKDIQGLADQALIAAYNTQFSAPQKRFESPIILPAHIQRFVQILADQNSDPKILSQVYDLFSNPAHDQKSALVNGKLAEMVAGMGAFAWIKSDADRLARTIDLLRDRGYGADPARVRAYLADDSTAPAVRKSAMLFAERVRDQQALPYIAKFLGAGSGLPDEDAFFAVVSLDPSHPWVTNWINGLRQRPGDDASREGFEDKLALTARVAAELTQSTAKRIGFFEKPDPLTLDFAATAVTLIMNSEGRFSLSRNIGRDIGEDEYEISVGFPRRAAHYVIKSTLFLGAGTGVVSKLCADLITQRGIPGILAFVSNITPPEKRFNTPIYNLEAKLNGQSSMHVEVDGTAFSLTNSVAELSRISTQGQEALRASWRTDEGTIKTGTVKSVDVPAEAAFLFHVAREDQ